MWLLQLCVRSIWTCDIITSYIYMIGWFTNETSSFFELLFNNWYLNLSHQLYKKILIKKQYLSINTYTFAPKISFYFLLHNLNCLSFTIFIFYFRLILYISLWIKNIISINFFISNPRKIIKFIYLSLILWTIYLKLFDMWDIPFALNITLNRFLKLYFFKIRKTSFFN